MTLHLLGGSSILLLLPTLGRSNCHLPACWSHLQVETAGTFGEVMAVDLKPDGADIAVGQHNVEEYVQLYVQHLLVGSIQRQFAAFQRGFLRLCSGTTLQFFRCAQQPQLVLS